LDKSQKEIETLTTQIEEYNKIIAQKNAEKQRLLTTPVVDLFAEELEKEKERLSAEIGTLTSQVGNEDENMDTNEGEPSLWKQKKLALQKIDSIKKQIEELQQVDLEANLENEITSKKQEKEQELTALRKEKDTLATKIEDIQKKISNLDEQRQKIKEQVERGKVSKEIGAFKVQSSQMQNTFRQLEKSLEKAEQEYQTIGVNKETDLKASTQAKDEQVQSLEKAIENIQSTISSLEKQIEEQGALRGKKLNTIEKIIALNDTLYENISTDKSVDEDISLNDEDVSSNSEEKLDVISSFLADLQDEQLKKSLQEKYAELLATIQNHSDFSQENGEIATRQAKIKDLEQETETLKNQIDVLEEKAGALQAKIDVYEENPELIDEEIQKEKIIEIEHLIINNQEEQLINTGEISVPTGTIMFRGREIDLSTFIDDVFKTTYEGAITNEDKELIDQLNQYLINAILSSLPPDEEDSTTEINVDNLPDFEVKDTKSKNFANAIMTKFAQEIEQKETKIKTKGEEIKTLQQEIESIEDAKITNNSSLAKEDIQNKAELEKKLESSEEQKRKIESKYDATRHQELEKKSTSPDKDKEILIDIVTQEREQLLKNNNDVKALMARLQNALEKIDIEWLKNINIDNLTEVNLEEVMANLKLKNDKMWKKILNVL
jgi:chromosome segregation ATPase